MSDPLIKCKVKDLIVKHMSGPSPTCEERTISDPTEWGLLKTTSVVWDGWNANAHKVPPRQFWGNKSLEVHPGDVLITKAGPRERVGVVVYVDETPPQIMVSGKMIGLRPNIEKVDSRVLAATLSSDKVQRYLDARTTGMADSQLNFTNELLLNTELEIPNPEYHSKFGEFISLLNKNLKLSKSLIEKYQKIKAGLMHDLFTRGVTPDGKLRPPRKQAPELYQETPIGWIPKEWDCHEIRHYVRSAQYGISTSLSDLERGIPVLRMNNIQSNRFDVSDLKYSLDSEAYRLRLKAGDVLYNRTNSMEHVGKTAMWRDELDECSFASYLVRINLNDGVLIPGYFCHWMSQEFAQNALRRFATPSVQQVNINPTNLQRVLLSCPRDIEEQKCIVERIDSIDRKIDAEKRLSNKLKCRKQGLMHDLLTGQVKVNINQPKAAGSNV